MKSDDIKKLIEELLRSMQISFDAVELRSGGDRDVFSIKSNDSHLLIGSRGAHLFALSHLVKKIVARKESGKKTAVGAPDASVPVAEREYQFMIDVNDYQGQAQESLKNIAKVMGERARSLKTNIELDPMSSYERMIVHSFFEGVKDIKTESVGVGERRRVVIKYVE